MNRLLVVAVILAVTCAMELNYNYKPGTWRHLAKKHLHHHHPDHHLERRQFSPECTRALDEYDTSYFQGCIAVLDKFSTDDITNDDLEGYCTKRCNSEIISVSTDLAVYCDGGGVSQFCVTYRVIHLLWDRLWNRTQFLSCYK